MPARARRAPTGRAGRDPRDGDGDGKISPGPGQPDETPAGTKPAKATARRRPARNADADALEAKAREMEDSVGSLSGADAIIAHRQAAQLRIQAREMRGTAKAAPKRPAAKPAAKREPERQPEPTRPPPPPPPPSPQRRQDQQADDATAPQAVPEPLNRQEPARPPQPPPVPQAPPPAAARPASWRDTDDPAEIQQQMSGLMNAGETIGFTKPVPLQSGVYVGEAADPATHARRVNRVGQDMARLFGENPKLAALRDRNPVSIVGFSNTPGVTVQQSAAAGWHAAVDGPDGSRTTLLVVGTQAGAERSVRLGGEVVGESATSTFRHEYAHHLEKTGLARERAEFQAIYEGRQGGIAGVLFAGRNRRAAQAKWASGVSKYAASDASELWSESFSAYTSPHYGKPGSDRLPKELEDFWRRTIG